jgi:hypothetical protein
MYEMILNDTDRIKAMHTDPIHGNQSGWYKEEVKKLLNDTFSGFFLSN